MINAVLNGLSKDLRNLIAFDIVVFILLITFVNAYKTYFLILTCALVTYLSYRLVSYFIEISTTATPPSRSANQEDDFYEFKLANLLFRNATLIRTIKMLSRNRFVRFSVYNIPIEKARAESNAAAANGGAAAATTTSTKKEGKYDERGLPESISRFTRKVSVAYIERWYFPFVSKNDQFLKEISIHVETLLNDLFSRFLRMDKQQIFADGIYVANNNFFNMAFYNYLNGGNAQIPLEILHPAVRNSPASEMAYLKRVVLLGFRKSLPHISINEPVLEELFCQIFGKNVLQLVVDILSKPNFLWWCIGAICDRDKAVDLFAPPDYKPDDPGINPPWAQPLPGAVALQQRQELIEKLQKQQQQKAFNLSHHNHSAYSVSSPSQQQQQQRRKSLSSASTGNMSLRNPVYDLENQQPLEYLYFQINNIKIVDTEISVELKSGKEFTLYNIQFEYRLRDMYNTTPELNSDCQIKKLRRRYKEFVSLQKSLEENPQFKHFLKNIKTPAKYLVLPIGNMESEYVEKRRKRLNDYLNNLVKIPEICQSRELISFLDLDSNDAFVRSNNIFDKVTGVLEKISPVGHFNRKAEELDLAIEFGKLTATSYEYTNHDTYEKFYYRLSSILEKAKAKNENNAEKKSGEESEKSKKPHLPQTNTHFSKICFEIWNKAIASASFAKGGDGHRWINNKNVYKLIEVAICDYYVEDFFAEMFNGILSPDFMVIYLQLLEYLLFEKRQRPPINFDDPKLDFHGFALNEIFNIVPKICQMAIHEELFKSSITILIGSLGSPLLNKHIFYSVLDLILLNLYGEDFNKCDQQQQPQTSTNNNQ